ncbi:hypothetical protein ARMSODRAFT_1024102 [Armillaria solidipes]|uniref:Uncharacterized protein n=1 Tax=Armillaria solidipes TaxID=1076256 RepID=A0A2H3AXD6_9AGAR|nr:hypothetical protein ARMSODRAFT_1024102 [Armillaria solidipes]
MSSKATASTLRSIKPNADIREEFSRTAEQLVASFLQFATPVLASLAAPEFLYILSKCTGTKAVYFPAISEGDRNRETEWIMFFATSAAEVVLQFLK